MSRNSVGNLKEAFEALLNVAGDVCDGQEELHELAKWIRDQLNHYGLEDSEDKK